MWRIVTLMLLLASGSRSQLNYEGNPLTENTEYTAEETHYAERHDTKISENFNNQNEYIDSYVVAANNLARPDSEKIINENINKLTSLAGTTNYEISPQNTNQIMVMNKTQLNARQMTSPSANALTSFLNSKTPEESQWALDNYLKNQQHTNQAEAQINFSDNQLQNEQVIGTTYPQQEYENAHIFHKNQVNSLVSSPIVSDIVNQGSSSIVSENQMINTQPYLNPPLTPWPQVGFQSRNDFMVGPRRRPPPYQYRNMPSRMKNRYRLQSRIGPGFIPKPAHFHGPPGFHPGEKPIEIIYTRPPGFAHGPPPISNPPVPFEDAGAYFPESDHQPVPKDVYYSQLWAQSYDPHYYNYIAKTGKIKPWLYGKLGKNEDSSFWSELFLSFKKHGMKNMMNPMFLLGLSIPALTLMLSALIQKRSFARSNSDYHISEEKINELVEKVRWAIECYEKNKENCSK